MASISETAAMVNAASTEVQAAAQALQQAEEAIDRARRAIFEAMGDATPSHLIDYAQGLDNAISKLGATGRTLGGCISSGEAYIQQLYS